MNTSIACNKKKSLVSTFGVLLFLFSLLLLQGCDNDDDTEVVVAGENASGYFTGSATVKAEDNMTDMAIADLQGMVSGNRFMFMSIDDVLLYDGVFTSIVGNDFKGTVKIYKDGVLFSDKATVSGMVTAESAIEGVIVGEGVGNGTFNLTYSLNNAPSSSERIDSSYRGWLNVSDNEGNLRNFLSIGISNVGAIESVNDFPIADDAPLFLGCVIDASTSKALPITENSVYSVSMVFSNCDNALIDGLHTGFAITQDTSDMEIFIAFSNGAYSGNAFMEKLPF